MKEKSTVYYYSYDLVLRAYLETNECIWKSKIWSHSVSGTVNDECIEFGFENIILKESCTTGKILERPKGKFLELKLEMTMLQRPSDKNPLRRSIDITAQYKNIIANCKCILNESKYSDFIFIVKGKSFKVHKNILAAASPVFDKLFSAELKESRSNECDVNNIQPFIFECLLNFIYSGELPENLHEENVAQSLFEAAHLYQIDKLVDICKQVEHFKLSADNAVELYKWAWTYDLDDLKLDAWNFIKL